MQPLFVTKNAQTGTEGQADFAGQSIAQFQKELLRGLVLYAGVGENLCKRSLGCEIFRLSHQRKRDSTPAKFWIDYQAMYHDRRLLDVPAHLRILRCLLGRYGGNTGDGAIDVDYP